MQFFVRFGTLFSHVLLADNQEVIHELAFLPASTSCRFMRVLICRAVWSSTSTVRCVLIGCHWIPTFPLAPSGCSWLSCKDLAHETVSHILALALMALAQATVLLPVRCTMHHTVALTPVHQHLHVSLAPRSREISLSLDASWRNLIISKWGTMRTN